MAILSALKGFIAGTVLGCRQLAVLLELAELGPQDFGALVKSLGISGPALSRALDHLGTLKFVTRTRNENDRRHVMVALAPAGTDFMRRFYGNIHPAVGKLGDTLIDSHLLASRPGILFLSQDRG